MIYVHACVYIWVFISTGFVSHSYLWMVCAINFGKFLFLQLRILFFLSFWDSDYRCIQPLLSMPSPLPTAKLMDGLFLFFFPLFQIFALDGLFSNLFSSLLIISSPNPLKAFFISVPSFSISRIFIWFSLYFSSLPPLPILFIDRPPFLLESLTQHS